MDTPSVAEIRKRFHDKPIMIKPHAPKLHTIAHESSIDSSISEKSGQSNDEANPTISDSVGLSSQGSDETSSSREKILARIRSQGGQTSFIKPPVPLPPRNENTGSQSSNVSQDLPYLAAIPLNANSSTDSKKPHVSAGTTSNRDRYDDTPSESSTISQGGMLPRVFPPNPNAVTGLKKAPVPLPSSVNLHRNDPEHFAAPTISQNPMSSPIISNSTNNPPGINKPPVPLPTQDRHEITHYESLSVSLDAVLSSKCMFFEFENIINDYKRKDPRTIIYPKTKPTMPKITTNEINILQRYLNT